MHVNFGKFHGLLLVILGLLLLGLQAWLFTSTRSDQAGRPDVSSTQPRDRGPAVHYRGISKLPALLGGASLILGVAVVYTHRRQPPEQRG